MKTEAQESTELAIDFARPTRHFRVPNPARLSDADALSIYDRIREDMVAAYRLSQNPLAGSFMSGGATTAHPTCPPLMAIGTSTTTRTPTPRAYGREGAGPMPKGSVLAKDSFTVTRRGDVFTGPLFLMEKMAPGFAPEGRDWRYTMIMPDGSFLGVTNGEGSEKVEFCATCHATAGDAADHLFFVPEKYRARFLQLDENG